MSEQFLGPNFSSNGFGGRINWSAALYGSGAEQRYWHCIAMSSYKRSIQVKEHGVRGFQLFVRDVLHHVAVYLFVPKIR
jgi:hypothetical protein